MKTLPIAFRPWKFRFVERSQTWQTRRLVKPQPVAHTGCMRLTHSGEKEFHVLQSSGGYSWIRPRFLPGNLLYWSNEPVEFTEVAGQTATLHSRYRGGPRYVDIPDRVLLPVEGRYRGRCLPPEWAHPWRGRVDAVHCQRVQEITDADALAEGVDCWYETLSEQRRKSLDLVSARDLFHFLWNSIYGKDAWTRNDWVWVYEGETL